MSLKSYRTIRTLLGEFSLLDVVSITVFFGALPEVLFSLIDFFLQGEGNSLKRAGLLALITAVALAYISVRYKKLKEFFEERDYQVEEVLPSAQRVFITALSLPKLSEEELLDIKHKKSLKEIREKYGKNFTWIPYLETIEDLRSKAKLEKIVVIPSEQSKNYYKHFEKMVNELFGGLSVEQFGPANYDDFDDIQKAMRSALKELQSRGYKKSEIIVGITGGTSAFSVVASALTLPSKMALSYYTQNAKKIVYVNIEPVENE